MGKRVWTKRHQCQRCCAWLYRDCYGSKMPEKVIDQMKAVVSLQRLGEPRDIANAYLFFASEESDYVHGHVLHVDGGIMM